MFGGTVLSKPIQLFSNVVLARLLGPANYGVMGLATSLAVTLSLVTSLGLGDAMTRFVAEHSRRDPVRAAKYASLVFWTAICFSSVFFLALWIGRQQWRSYVFPGDVSNLTIGLCLCLAFLNLVFALLLGAFAGSQLFKDLTILNLLQAITLALFAVVLARYSTEGAVLAYVCGTAISVGWGLTKLWRFNKAMLRFPLSEFAGLKTVFYFCSPIWLGSFILSPVTTYTYALLAAQPFGTFELGLFSTAIGLRTIVTILPGVVGIVISPALFQEGGQHGQATAYADLLRKSFLSLIFLTLPLLVLFLFLADFVFLVYGREFSNAYKLFAPLAASAAIGAVGAPLIIVFNAKNRTWWSLAFGIVKSIMLVLLAIWWVPTHLSSGLAWAVLISETGFYLLATEFCVAVRIVPAAIRKLFYPACLSIGLIVVAALFLPNVARWIAAVPVSAIIALVLVRTSPSIATWLSESVPNPLRPRAESILNFITS